MKFKLPEIKPPTEDEMKEIARNWWIPNEPVSFLAWNDTLKSHSFPYYIIKLPTELIREGLDLFDNRDKENLSNIVDKYDDLISEPLKQMGCTQSFFCKLISRSPKDYLSDNDNHTLPIALRNARQLVDALMSSMRCFEDLCMLQYLPNVSSLVLRPYLMLEASDEWRVFVREGKIAGISQYYYQSRFDRLSEAHVDKVGNLIANFVSNTVTPNMPIDTYVVDFVTDGIDIKILETNPYGLSDPCLFGDYASLDGGIRWRK